MRNKSVVFGAAGSLGSELARQLTKRGDECLLFDINETELFNLFEELKQDGHNVHYRVGDVRTFHDIKEVLTEFRPSIVYHAAALKNVTPGEWSPEQHIRTNAIGTLNVVLVCKKYGIKLVNTSTDKVVNAESIMGITKKLAEHIVKNAGFISVRFGNVLRSNGSILDIWQRQFSQNKPLTITDPNCQRFMMTIPQAVELVITASEIGKPGQIFVLDVGDPVKIIDLAKEFLEERNNPNYPIQIIGLRPGESLKEKLWSENEKPRREGKFYIID